jgi:peptidoglycan/xylan/chitin deacetylase (PgdA/CDA1 family)
LGYEPWSLKVAVFCSKNATHPTQWRLIERATKREVAKGSLSPSFGAYGPFQETSKIDFSFVREVGVFVLEAAGVESPPIHIAPDVYKGSAEFCLQYIRQQRSSFNPSTRDSCHTRDGYTLGAAEAGISDSSFLPVSGGWHDASDYLQYATTSTNTIWHLLKAYESFPHVFTDRYQDNGLSGRNGLLDIADEALWGLKWLYQLFPKADQLYFQVGDDRDHVKMRLPGEDSGYYGRGIERPVYFLTGKPQQRGKYLNHTTGTSSMAAKFSTCFATAQQIQASNPLFFDRTRQYDFAKKSLEAWAYAHRRMGVSQTVSVRSPYIYAEENWADDMELAAASLYAMQSSKRQAKGRDTLLQTAYRYLLQEPVTPWMGADTAHHYQWYPFVNPGHYTFAQQSKGEQQAMAIEQYRVGIERVYTRARQNAFNRGIPFIWCSNNLTAAFAAQCYWYRTLSKDEQYRPLEQACIDWILGCNPWGSSMIYGLPADADHPADPHAAFTHLARIPINGGLVDGPVYGSIFRSLIGIKLEEADEYAPFQSDLAVYHDDYGDYSTNEPTLDGTAVLMYVLAARESEGKMKVPNPISAAYSRSAGALVRGDISVPTVALAFTGDEFGEGTSKVLSVLKSKNVKASFYLTGNYIRKSDHRDELIHMMQQGHEVGPHSDQHLLYCDWKDRNQLLVGKDSFMHDLEANIRLLQDFGLPLSRITHFIPPYEWYNPTIADWSKMLGLQLVNYTPGLRTAADYTTPLMNNYRSSQQILTDLWEQEKKSGLNGFVILIHLGTHPDRTDKLYDQLDQVVDGLISRGYQLRTVQSLFGY